MTAAIVTEALGKSYGRVTALEALSLRVEHGEVFGFLGPNGAGKTTTIRMLLGLVRPSAGTAQVLGQPAGAHGTALRSDVGYLPGDRLPTAIRLATAGNKNQTARLGLKPLRKRKRLREIELGDDPGHVRRRPQCSVGLRRDGRKDNRGIGKESIAMPKDER